MQYSEERAGQMTGGVDCHYQNNSFSLKSVPEGLLRNRVKSKQSRGEMNCLVEDL